MGNLCLTMHFLSRAANAGEERIEVKNLRQIDRMRPAEGASPPEEEELRCTRAAGFFNRWDLAQREVS